MCAFSQPKAPPAVVVPETPPMVPEPQAAPQESNPQVQASRDQDRMRKMRGAAQNNTLVTGGQGLLDQPALAKQYLGT